MYYIQQEKWKLYKLEFQQSNDLQTSGKVSLCDAYFHHLLHDQRDKKKLPSTSCNYFVSFIHSLHNYQNKLGHSGYTYTELHKFCMLCCYSPISCSISHHFLRFTCLCHGLIYAGSSLTRHCVCSFTYFYRHPTIVELSTSRTGNKSSISGPIHCNPLSVFVAFVLAFVCDQLAFDD